MIRILKRKDFMRWQVAERLPDAALCKAVREMEAGLIDADIGGGIFKKRVARPGGGGKSVGYGVVLAARIGDRYVFLHGFAKHAKANISPIERRALQAAGKIFLGLMEQELLTALRAGILWEVQCEQAH